MPVCRHKNRIMFRIFNFTKKYFRYQSDNDYPAGMDTTPTISFGANNKKYIKHTIVNARLTEPRQDESFGQAFGQGQISGKPDYRLTKKRRDNRHAQNF